MLQLAGLSKTEELSAPSREEFLALNKAQKYAAIGVGLLTLARCDALYDHTARLCHNTTYAHTPSVDPWLESVS